ncbi:MAG: uracil-DNA glycosylase [Magnetococcus sp. XQGC-1]
MPPPLPVVPVEVPWSDPTPGEQRPGLLAGMAEEVRGCTRCPLAKTRNQTVFGVGNPEASVVFVGEGPGAEEDQQGEPFVGAAGRLLDQMLRAIRMQRSEVFIANVVKCRPPGNRTPHMEEMVACQGYLFRQLEIIRPQVIFCLGKVAILCLTGHADAVGLARSKPFVWHGIPVIASYHPAYYLRTPSRKRAAWEDLLRLTKLLAK